MTHRDHVVAVALAACGTLLVLFQCWYVYLPVDRAAEFDLCQLTEHVDCFKALEGAGPEMTPFGLPVFAALAALFLFQLMLGVFAWAVAAQLRETWLAVAGLASFPASGLAVYVLLHNIVVSKVTSVSALLVAATGLALSARVVLKGFSGASLWTGASRTLLLAAAAALMGFFLHGAGTARHELDRAEHEQESAPPGVRWSRFDLDMPRAGAAMLGDPMANEEVLVFVDPSQEESRQMMRRLADDESGTLYVFYAPGDDGARMILAHRQGKLREYLRTLRAPEGDLTEARAIVARQERGRKKLGVTKYPTVR